MAKNVLKGLTIEIGGDTTKLEKALTKVNAGAKNVSSELGEINRLLKMDPGNTDLLAQKQEVLANAINQAKEKLELLKEAEKQVQEQFKRGEASEEQVRALQREIIGATKKLETYEKAAADTTDALQRLSEETKDAGEAAEDYGKDADKAGDALKDLGDESKKAEKESKNLGNTHSKVTSTGLKAVAAAAAAAVTALVGIAESTRDYRMEMGKLDTAFTQNGFSSEAAKGAYKELVGILGETDQSVEAASHLAKLTDNEKDLAHWTGDILPGVFATFGDSLPIEGLTEAANETAKVGQVTGPLADALNWAGVSEDTFNESLEKCTSEQERQALITQTLTDLYGGAAEAYKETNAEVIRANEANEEWTASMADVGGAIEPILTDVKLLGAEMLTTLVPSVQLLAESFRSMLNGEEGGAEEFGELLSGLVSGLLSKVTELAPTMLQVATSFLGSLTSSLLSLLPTVLQTLMQMASDLLLQLAVILPPLLNQLLTETIPQLITTLLTYAPQLLQAGITLLHSLIEALPVIINELLIALPGLTSTIITFLMESIPMLLEGATQLLLAIVEAIPEILPVLVETLPQILDCILDLLLDPNSISQILDAAFALFMAVVESIPLIVVELAKALPKIWETMKSFLRELPGKVWNILKLVIDKVNNWATELRSKARDAASRMVNAIADWIVQLPTKFATWLRNVINKVTSWATDLVSKGKDAAKRLVSSIVDGVKSLPEKMLRIGGDLISGLWNGISDKFNWLKNKISGFASNVLDSIKSFFGVHSPSTETAWIGDMLDQGLAKGVLDHANDPIKAMQRVSDGILDAAAGDIDGLNLNRQLSAQRTASAAAASNGGLLDKLDRILSAIERGQILTIDGDILVGATADRYDSELGLKRTLAARGAI